MANMYGAILTKGNIRIITGIKQDITEETKQDTTKQEIVK